MADTAASTTHSTSIVSLILMSTVLSALPASALPGISLGGRSPLPPQARVDAALEVLREHLLVHCRGDQLQQLDVAGFETLLHLLRQVVENFDRVEAPGAQAILRIHLVHGLDERELLRVLHLGHLPRRLRVLRLLILLLVNHPLLDVLDEVVDRVVEGSSRVLLLEAVEELSHQVAGRTLHELGELVDLGYDLALPTELDHLLRVAAELLLQRLQHVVAVGVLVHEDVPVLQQHGARLLPARLRVAVEEGLVLGPEGHVLVRREVVLSRRHRVVGRLDDGALLLDFADVSHVERSSRFNLGRLGMIALRYRLLLRLVEFILLRVP
mmetsp:Transcript_19879/g.55920  ORF Transcript_19879/g.55920 Transcript_19879/m.55920 type:complete len:326 (-) Transcript_19879:202-1179(-)